VRFNPRQIAFTNLATIFAPAEEYSTVPFDLLLLSNVYVFYHALAARMGVLRTCRSHIYPTNLALFPWNDTLLGVAADLESLRGRVEKACRNSAMGNAAMLEELARVELQPLKRHMLANKAIRIAFGDNFSESDYSAEVLNPSLFGKIGDAWRLQLSGDDLFDWVEINDEPLVRGLLKALTVLENESLSMTAIKNLPVPVAESECEAWDAVINKFHPAQLENAKAEALRALDLVIGPALGLSNDDLEVIWSESANDPFLKRVKPRYPGTVTRKLGFRTRLDSAARYE
jgi:hypothetical protein